MTKLPSLPIILSACALLLAATLSAAGTPRPAPPRTVPPRPPDQDITFFESRVRPLLAARCYACHAGKKAQAGLRLDGAEGMQHGGSSGPAVLPGDPDRSRLIEAVRYTNPRLQMPPTGKLPQAEIEILTTWVQRGAVWPSGRMKAEGGRMKEGTRKVVPPSKHWAFAPLRAAPAPRLKNQAWVRRPIDAFILAKLEAAGLHPSPHAEPRTLIRRAYFDLIGLPPTPEEVEQFVSEVSVERQALSVKGESSGLRATVSGPRPRTLHAPRSTLHAYERLIDRLLASPHYGERWGRHWLDLARYCDIPESWAQTEAQAWLYRDWVVRALNDDVPYDRFVRLQLAADEMPGIPPADLAALGFLGLSPSYWKELKLAPDVIKTVVAEEWEERINTVTGTFLGLTVSCARCHDHKFDPISQKDYYALAGVFASTRLTPRPLLPDPEARQVLQAREQVRDLEAETKRLTDAAAKDAGKAADLKRQADASRAKAEEIRRTTPHFDAPLAYGVDDASLSVLPDGPDRTRLDYRMGTGQDVALQVRGNPANPGPVVPRHFLAVLSPGAPAPFTRGSGRRELADALFRDAAPLAARVMVNRVWKHHFGRGLVETPSNFGIQGDHPTHPELLDDLAARFIRSGWSLKWLHREIMLSATYQQSGSWSVERGARSVQVPNPGTSPHRPNAQRPTHAFGSTLHAPRSTLHDPENRLLGRMNPRRLEVEAWRDAILSAAGTLDRRMGGAPQELSVPENVRRTVYGTVRRRELDDLLRLYDFPDPVAHNPARFHTTTPLQQLFVLNSEFIGRQAAALAARVRSEVPDGTEGQVRRAYLLLYSRPPSAREAQSARDYLQSAAGAAPSAERWNELAEVLLARSEMIFVD